MKKEIHGVIAIIETPNGILLTERQDGKGWCLPGGGFHLDEGPAVAIKRECDEEVGLAPIFAPFGVLIQRTRVGSHLEAGFLFLFYTKLEALPEITLDPAECVNYQLVTLEEIIFDSSVLLASRRICAHYEEFKKTGGLSHGFLATPVFYNGIPV